MIRSWANSATRRFVETGKSKFPGMDVDRADELLVALDGARSLSELSPLKHLGLHPLKGERKGQWAMTIKGRGGFASNFVTEMRMKSKSSIIIERRGTLRPVHPGRILRGEMEERALSASALALALRVPANRISEIVKGRRAITAETALRLGRYFGTGPELWAQLQTNYDLAVAEREHGPVIRREVETAV
jgi:addiction module HigA family antidote